MLYLRHNCFGGYLYPITYNHLLSPRKLEGLGNRAKMLPRCPQASSTPRKACFAPANPVSSARLYPRGGPPGHVATGGGEVGGLPAAILPAWGGACRAQVARSASPPLGLPRSGFCAPPHFWLLWPLPEWRSGEPRRAGGCVGRVLARPTASRGRALGRAPGAARGRGEGAAPAAGAARGGRGGRGCSCSGALGPRVQGAPGSELPSWPLLPEPCTAAAPAPPSLRTGLKRAAGAARAPAAAPAPPQARLAAPRRRPPAPPRRGTLLGGPARLQGTAAAGPLRPLRGVAAALRPRPAAAGPRLPRRGVVAFPPPRRGPVVAPHRRRGADDSSRRARPVSEAAAGGSPAPTSPGTAAETIQATAAAG